MLMTRVLALSLFLAGCAAPPQSQPQPQPASTPQSRAPSASAPQPQPGQASAPQPTASQKQESRSLLSGNPVCGSPVQCKIMWIRAHEALEQLTGMRVRSMTATSIRTDPAAGPGLLQGTVTRNSLPNDRYEIRATFDCFPRDPRCGVLRDEAANAFNRIVSAAAADVR